MDREYGPLSRILHILGPRSSRDFPDYCMGNGDSNRGSYIGKHSKM